MSNTQQAEVILKVNSKEATQRLEQLKQRASDLRKEFNEAFKRGDTKAIDKANKELQKVNREMDSMRTNAANIRAAMVRLDEATPKELQRTIRQINTELNSGRVKRGSKEWEEYIARLKEVKHHLKEVKAEMADAGAGDSFLDKVKDSLDKWGLSAAAGIGAFAGLAMSAKGAVQAYADMEAEEANVSKYTGMTADEVERLNEAFKTIDARTSREDLNRLAQEAGRLGKTSVDDVLGFVRAADQINVALDDLGEGATLTLSKLTGIFGDEKIYGTEQSLLKVGSVINELSQNCSASAPYLAEFSSRLGNIAAQSKMSISQVMAFAAVLDTQNLAVEASSTAVGQLITKIYNEPAKIAKAAGIDVKKFSDMVKTDMNGALIMLFEELNQFGGMESLAKVFDNMGTDGARAVPVLSALAGHVDELKQQQIEANKAFAEGTSVYKEFYVQNNTDQAKLDKKKKVFGEFAISLGKQLLPAMNLCISGSTAFMRVISTLFTFLAQHKASVIAVASAFVILKLAIVATAAETKIMMALEKGYVIIQTALATAIKAVSVVYYALTGNMNKAKVAHRALRIELSKTPWGAIAMALGLVLAAIVEFCDATQEAARKSKEYKKSLEDLSKSSRDYTTKAKQDCADQVVALETLYKAATDEKKSKEERFAAAQKLLNQYPDTFAAFSAEQIMLGNAKQGYEELTKAILDNAKARAAAELYKDNYKEILRLEAEIDSVTEERDNAQAELDKKNARNNEKNRREAKSAQTLTGALVTASQGPGGFATNTTQNTLEDTSKDREIVKTKNETLDQLNDEIKIRQKSNDYLDRQFKDNKIYTKEKAGSEIEGPSPDISYTGNTKTPPKSDKEIKAEEREAKKAAAEAQKALKEELKAQEALRDQALADNQRRYNEEQISYDEFLDNKDRAEMEYYERAKKVLENKKLTETAEYAELCKKEEELRAASTKRIEKRQISAIKADNAREQALNKALYRSGEKDYLDYVADKERLDREYIDRQLKAYESAGLTQTEQYARLLDKKEDLEDRQHDAQVKRSLAEIELSHKARQSELNANYHDPVSAAYGDKKALTEAQLAEDIRYLRRKQALYRKNTEEWAQLESQISDRTAQAKLDKQKEFAEAYAAFESKYRKASGSKREQLELDMLKQLYDKKLIAEKEYQKAVADIRARYRQEDLDKEYRAQSEWGDIVTNLFNVMSGNWEAITDKELDLIDKIAIGMQAGLAAMSAMLSQYTAYANAERDLELAKIEERYDAEIKAAGNNEKKRKKIEKRKEAEIAKVKKKYNDRAMKIEIAQAIAQTALAAISAYASASKVNWLLGPIAAAMATAAGAIQIATIKKQHDAESAGYYEGGFTRRDPDNRKEAGVVHTNEFVMNHKAVANPALMPLLRVIDHAQRTNTVGSLTSADVARAIGITRGVVAGGGGTGAPAAELLAGTIARFDETNAATRDTIDRLNENLEGGIETYVVMDGERGLYRRFEHYKKLIDNPRR